MKYTFFLLLVIASLNSYGQNVNAYTDEGKINGNTYINHVIGWTINVPEGWDMVPITKSLENDKIGKQAMEETLEAEIDVSKLKHLISFKKDQLNIFMSTSEPIVEEYPNEYADNNKALKEVLYQTLAGKGMDVDTSSAVETINGLDFSAFYIVLKHNGNFVLGTIMYNRLIKGYDFGMTVNYTNLADKNAMLNAVRSSKFK